jgi:hypothetical protein
MPLSGAAPRHWAVNLDKCVSCGHQAISYNSCRDRNCPKCKGNARAKWLAARSAELLPVPYFHIVFTLPTCQSAQRSLPRQVLRATT